MATEYVSLEKVIEIVTSYCPDDDGTCEKAGTDLREMLDEIESISAEYVVEVVRCSVCKKVVIEDKGNGKSAYWCPVNRNYRCFDEFCNRGKRRE